jgi:hypothetical protein
MCFLFLFVVIYHLYFRSYTCIIYLYYINSHWLLMYDMTNVLHTALYYWLFHICKIQRNIIKDEDEDVCEILWSPPPPPAIICWFKQRETRDSGMGVGEDSDLPECDLVRVDQMFPHFSKERSGFTGVKQFKKPPPSPLERNCVLSQNPRHPIISYFLSILN